MVQNGGNITLKGFPKTRWTRLIGSGYALGYIDRIAR